MKSFATLAAAAALAALASTAARADGYPHGLIGAGLVGPYGYAQDPWVASYYGPGPAYGAWSWGSGCCGARWAWRDYYHRAPVYGTGYAAPSYVDEDCRIRDDWTAYGWRRYRVCE